MGLHLSSGDLDNYERALHCVLSPLTYPDRAAWVADLGPRLMDLFHGQHLALILPRAQDIEWHTMQICSESLAGMHAFVESTPEELQRLDAVLARIETRRRELRMDAWQMDMLDHVLEERTPFRSTSFFQEYFAPARIRDSRNFAVQLPVGPVMMCVSREERPETDPLGAAALPLLHLVLAAFRSSVDTLVRWETERMRLSALLDQVPQPMMVADACGVEIHRNTALVRLLARIRGADELIAGARQFARALTAPHCHSSRVAIVTGGVEYIIRGSYAPAEAFGAGAVLITVDAPASSALPTTEEISARWALTRREAEIALLLARRVSNREIAAQLFLSPHTVRHHAERIFLKVGVHSRRELLPRLLSVSGT